MNKKNYPNLKPWTKGTSGNPSGRKPGSKNVSTIVRELLEQDVDTRFPLSDQIEKVMSGKSPSYAKAIIIALMIKAIEGDVRAANWLFEHGYAYGSSDETQGLFNTEKLIVEVVGTKQSALD